MVLSVWWSHVNVPFACSLCMNSVTHSWPCVTSCVTTNRISHVGVKGNIFQWMYWLCAKSWVNTFTHVCHTVVCTQNINVSPNKNVCNPEGAQENGSLCTLPCTNMKCTHRAWCTTACMVAWNRLCMHACINAHICMSHDEYDHRGINTILNARWASFTIVCHLAQVVAFNITLC